MFHVSRSISLRNLSYQKKKKSRNFRCLSPTSVFSFPVSTNTSNTKNFWPSAWLFPHLSPIPISVGLVLHFSSQTRDSDKKIRNVQYGMSLISKGWLSTQEIDRIVRDALRKQSFLYSSGPRIHSLFDCLFKKESSKDKDPIRNSGNLK